MRCFITQLKPKKPLRLQKKNEKIQLLQLNVSCIKAVKCVCVFKTLKHVREQSIFGFLRSESNYSEQTRFPATFRTKVRVVKGNDLKKFRKQTLD